MRLTNLKTNQNNSNNFRMNLTDTCKIKREYKKKYINHHQESKLDNLMIRQMRKIKFIIKRGQNYKE